MERLPRVPPLMAAAIDGGVRPDLSLERREDQHRALSPDRERARGQFVCSRLNMSGCLILS